MDFNHNPSSSCDGDPGYFEIRVEYNQLQTGFIYWENGPLEARTDLPPPAYVFKTFSRLGNGPQGAGEYLWVTTPTPKTLAKPTGYWLHMCQPACKGTATAEMTSSKNNETSQSVETTQAISLTLEAGIELKGFSANSSVTASATETLAHSLSQSISSGRLEGTVIEFGVSPEVALANNIFAIWRWIVDTPQPDGASYTFLTGKFTCTPDGNPPDYLPGSDQDLKACKTPSPAPATPGPAPATPGPVPVTAIEFYHASFDHYYFTWIADEITMLDNGTFKGWARTGLSFKAYSTPQSSTSAVCRIYIPPGKGDGHFFGRDANECDGTMTKHPDFILESSTFLYLFPPTLGSCGAGSVPVYRVFSNRADANHRYTTIRIVRDHMVATGWLAEGDGSDIVVMCAPQ